MARLTTVVALDIIFSAIPSKMAFVATAITLHVVTAVTGKMATFATCVAIFWLGSVSFWAITLYMAFLTTVETGFYLWFRTVLGDVTFLVAVVAEITASLCAIL